LCKIKVSIISKKRDLTVVTPFLMNCYKFAMILMILEQNFEDNFNQIISKYLQGGPYVSERFFKNGCGIEMSQATPTKFSMLFKHNYGKLF
jgi:hypothetical protein